MQRVPHAAAAGTLLQDVLPGVLNGSCCLEASVQPDGSAAFVRWYANAARGADGSASREHVEAQCVQLLSVLAQSLFCQQPAALSAFGAAFWGPFVAAYEGAFLQHIQGSSVAALQARQQAACDMEQHALSMGLAEPGAPAAGCRCCAAPEHSRRVCRPRGLRHAPAHHRTTPTFVPATRAPQARRWRVR
jgi:hypothetical protein